MPPEHVTGMISRRIVSGDRAMLAQITLKKGTIVPLHEHESEQVSHVIEGSLLFTIDGREHLVRAGEVLLIPSRVPHQAEALEDTLEFDVFSPIRQDWLDKTDDYLRR
jgi:quercetin dioxygenase-like cupin family protein